MGVVLPLRDQNWLSPWQSCEVPGDTDPGGWGDGEPEVEENQTLERGANWTLEGGGTRTPQGGSDLDPGGWRNPDTAGRGGELDPEGGGRVLAGRGAGAAPRAARGSGRVPR